MVVVERTPTTSEIRLAKNNFIIVTNDYKLISNEDEKHQNILNETSCGRYDQTQCLLQEEIPVNASSCFKILSDEKVKMQITVQQMVFNAKDNLIEVR